LTKYSPFEPITTDTPLELVITTALGKTPVVALVSVEFAPSPLVLKAETT